MDRAILFFDIDGTILSERTKQIPDSTIQAVRAAREKGHLLFINTGRTVCSIPSEVRRIGFDGYLCGCGTHLVCGDETLFSHSIPVERGREILDKMKECCLDGIAEGQEDVYFPERRSRFEKLETTRRYFREKGLGMEIFVEKGTFIYDKLFVYRDEKSDMESFLSFIEPDMEAMDRGNNTYEVVQKHFSKATACEQILQKYGVPRERAWVFGDSSNDLSMFQYAPHAVAMGEHSAVLDPYTEFVTKTVEEDGIEFAMKRYGLI